MWLLPKTDDEHIAIACSPHAITCSWIKPIHGTQQHELKAYRRYENNYAMHNSVIFNPTHIKQSVMQFLDAHNLHNAWTTISLQGPQPSPEAMAGSAGVFESITTLTTASPHARDFNMTQLKKLAWDYCYLYPKEDGTFAFYVCGITQQLLMQYKLLALSLPINIVSITTQTLALLRVYEHVHGASFRQSQLARDMEHNNQQLDALLAPDMLTRFLRIDPHLAHEATDFIPTFGLYLLGKDI